MAIHTLPSDHVFWSLTLVGCTWFFSGALWIVARSYTSAARTALFSQLYPLIILVYMHFTTRQTVPGEWIGMLIAIAGVLLAELLTSSGSGSKSELIGDVMCFGSAIISAVNVISTAYSRPAVPLWIFTAATNIWLIILGIPYVLLFESVSLSSLKPAENVFGLFFDPHLFLFVFVYGTIMGYLGVGMSNLALSIFNPVAFSAIQLLQPGITALQSWAVGIQPLPDAATWIGMAVIGIGIGVMVGSEEIKAKKLARDQQAKMIQLQVLENKDENVSNDQLVPHSDSLSHLHSHVSHSSVHSLHHPLFHSWRWFYHLGFRHHPHSILHPVHKYRRRAVQIRRRNHL